MLPLFDPPALPRSFTPLALPFVGVCPAVHDGCALLVDPEVFVAVIVVEALRAISARTVLSHLISSTSLGAESNRLRFVVTILNVWLGSAVSSPVEDEALLPIGAGWR